jgi:hypothetical protein
MTHMNYASNLGMHRTHCEHCKEVTLHKGAACIHCDSDVPRKLEPLQTWRERMATEATQAAAKKPKVRT